jgi:hypothetical protein
MPREGIMFVGEKGRIVGNYGYRNMEILGVENAENIIAGLAEPRVEFRDQHDEMLESFRGGKPSRGDYQNCQTVAEMINLGNLALRMGQRLEWDNENLVVTNLPGANEYVSRKYREGWEL